MKTLLVSMITVSVSTVAYATPYHFATGSGKKIWIEVEEWVGTGANETILVVDWNRLDANGADTVTESHAFGYRWDGAKYESDMLADFNGAGVLTVTTGYGGASLANIGFVDVDEPCGAHLHVEEGSWSLASTNDPDAVWGTWDNSEWDFNQASITAELLANGQIEGASATLWFGTMPSYANDQLDIPAPEPATMLLWSLGLTALVPNKRKRR